MNFIATSERLITLGCRGKGRQPQKGTGPFGQEPARKAWYRLKYLRYRTPGQAETARQEVGSVREGRNIRFLVVTNSLYFLEELRL